jgi:hypothetical protein
MLDFLGHIVEMKPFDPGIAGRDQTGAQRVIIAATDLVRSDGGVDFDEFVARGDNRDFGNLCDRQRGAATRRRDRDFTPRQPRSGPNNRLTGAMVAAAAVN